MLKNISQLEVKIEDRIYHFLCENDSPITHVKEALFQFVKFAGQIEDAAKSAQNEAEKAKQDQQIDPISEEQV